MRQVLLAWLVLGAVASCCSNDDADEPPIDAEERVTAIDCDNFIETLASPPSEASLVLDVVGLPAGSVSVGTRVGEEGTAQAGLLFTKFGLLVRAGEVAGLEVIEPETDALLEWGLAAGSDATRALTVGPCSQAAGSWLVFAGGIWTNGPGVVKLMVRTGGREELVTLRLEPGDS